MHPLLNLWRALFHGTRSQGLCWASKLLPQGQRGGWESGSRMCLQSWGEVRTRKLQRGTELWVCCRWIPFVQRGLVPSPSSSPGRLWTGLPTSSLSQVHTNHHYHISQAHTNTTSTCPQIHTTQLTGQPPHSSGLQAHTCPRSTHTHTSLCGINTDPVGSGRAARGWEWELVFSLWQLELKATWL